MITERWPEKEVVREKKEREMAQKTYRKSERVS